MNYTINIIDTTTNELVTSLEKAIRGGAEISKNGGDKKDDLIIVGSSLNLGIIAEKYVDGYLFDLFTGNETRYRVEVIDDNLIMIWQGHILPDQYSEPYTNTPVIDITATDGLGRLKGKFLPEDFYSEEKSVIAIISECLRLTGLELDLKFAPAIENTDVKDYDSIYIDTSTFKERDRKKDAFTILETFVGDLLSVLYQEDNAWNLEGINVRELMVYTTKVYDFEGNFIEDQTITRLLKKTNNIATPNITMQSPYGFIEVSHEREQVQFDERLTEEDNNGWTYDTARYRNNESNQERILSGQNIYALEWIGHNDFYAYAGEDSQVVFKGYSSNPDQAGQFLNLRRRPYIEQGKKYKISVSFSIKDAILESFGATSNAPEDYYYNIFKYVLSLSYDADYYNDLGYTVIATNNIAQSSQKYIPLNFDLQEKTVELELYYAPSYSGIIDMRIDPVDLNFAFASVDTLEIEELGFSDEQIITETLEGWTSKKEVELTYADDSTGTSLGFRLFKLNELDNGTNIQVPIKRNFTYQGFRYVVVDLKGANLIDENRDLVSTSFGITPIVDVIYNYNRSNEHVVKLDLSTSFDTFNVTVFNYNDSTTNRDNWQTWSDSIFKIENSRYAQAYADVLKRSFDKPLNRILDLKVKNNVKFNDFINFKFNSVNKWIVTNCKWNLDTGFTDVSISENYYLSEQGLSPVVEAGNDIYFTGTQAQLTSEAFDPDGFIASSIWEEITSNGAVITAPNAQNTTVTNLTESYYEFQNTVTDNDGNTGSDIVRLYKKQDIAISLVETFTDEGAGPNPGTGETGYFKEKHFKFTVTPEIVENTSLNINGLISLSDIGTDYGGSLSDIKIETNGVITREIALSGSQGTEDRAINDEYTLNYIAGDEIYFKIYLEAYTSAPPSLQTKGLVEIETVNYVDGFGDITGLPIEETLTVTI